MAVVFRSRTVLNTGFTPTSAQSAAFLARTTGLTNARKALYDTLITGLVNDGVWTIFDILYIYATQDSTTALLNLVANNFNGTANGSPTFTVDRGFTGVDSSSTVFIDTGFNPTSAPSPNFTQNSAHVSVWSDTNAASTATGGDMIGLFDAGFVSNTNVVAKYSDGNEYFRINDATASAGIANAVATGHYLANRSAAGAQQGYKNAVDQGVVAGASVAPANGNIYALASNRSGAAAGSALQITMASIGGSLTATNVSNFYTRLQTYMTAVGA